MKKLLLASLVLLGFANAFAADATVTFVKGKVEVLKGNEWVAVNQGDELSKSDVLNTGFNSEAKIKLFDSVMYLGPVTRISLDELSAQPGQDKVSVYLKTGNVRSQVNHTESKRVNYQVRTAVAVASVRGTDWTIDDSNNITCLQGAVATASVRALTPTANANMEEAEELPDDGVVVQANQSLAVSDTNFTSTPVNNVVQAVTTVTSGVAKASSKEAVAPTTAVTPAAVAAPVEPVVVVPPSFVVPEPEPIVEPPETPPTGENDGDQGNTGTNDDDKEQEQPTPQTPTTGNLNIKIVIANMRKAK